MDYIAEAIGVSLAHEKEIAHAEALNIEEQAVAKSRTAGRARGLFSAAKRKELRDRAYRHEIEKLNDS